MPDQTTPTSGVTIKSVTDDTVTVEGWAIVFGGEDLQGETFTKSTDLWFDRVPGTRPVLFEHGQDPTVKDAILGQATFDTRDVGVFVQANLDRHSKYMAFIQPLIEMDALGWSTGSVDYLSKRDGSTIKSFPVFEISMTTHPAEPRCLGIAQVKALSATLGELTAQLEAEAERTDAKAKLTTEARDKLPAADFAYIDRHGGRHLPVHDETHVRAAMGGDGFSKQEFESDAAKKKAAKKIIARARRFGIETDPDSDVATAAKSSYVKAASFEEIRDRVAAMLRPAASPFTYEPDWTYVVDTYPDYVIVCREDYDNDGDGGYWQIPYTVATDGTVTLGDAVQVEQTYTPVAKSITITEAHEPAPITGDEADMPLDKETQDALVEGVSAKFAPQFDAISRILERFENEPALKSAGHITQDGGTADKNIKSFADFLMATRRDDVKRLTEIYHTKAVAQAEDSGTVGGYLVPTEYVARLLQVAAEDSIVRPRAYIQPMAARELEIPALDQQTAPTAGNTSFYGGVQAVWTAEGGSYTQENTSFKLVRLVAHKLAGYTLASNELQADSAVALEALLTRLFGGAIGWYEDYSFLNGDGVAKPLGAVNGPSTIQVTRASGGNDFDPADIGAMLKRLLPSSARRAVWVMHPYILPSLLALSVGTSGFQTWVNNLRDSAPMTLLGLPVIFSEKMATAGSANDVLLADFSYYVIGDRQQINIASSEHYRFLNGQTTWRFEERVDGQPWMKSAITLSDASSTVSAFVTLQ